MSNKILLTAFRRSSAELLIKLTDDYETLLLPNDKSKDSEKLIKAITEENYDYIISFGQRPNIKNKVHIETTATDGDNHLHTDYDCDGLKKLFEQNGIPAKISHNAGTSFCNSLYFNGLNFLNQNKLKTKMVFVHIPFKKNIEDFDCFSRKVNEILKCIIALKNTLG